MIENQKYLIKLKISNLKSNILTLTSIIIFLFTLPCSAKTYAKNCICTSDNGLTEAMKDLPPGVKDGDKCSVSTPEGFKVGKFSSCRYTDDSPTQTPPPPPVPPSP